MRVVLLSMAALLSVSGCVTLDAPGAPRSSETLGAHANTEGVTAAPVFALPPSAPLPRLATALELSTQWAKPLEMVEMRASADASDFTWYVGLREGRTRVTYVDDVPYLTDADASRSRIGGGEGIRVGAIAPRARVDTGILSPGDAPVSLSFPVEGRFVLVGRDHAGGTLNITVASREATGAEGFVTIQGDPRHLRFEPDEVAIPPGGSVTFLDAAGGPAGATLARILVPLESRGASARVAAVDEGAYEVAVIARDGARGRGVASLAFLADFERPTVHPTFPSIDGTFACAGVPPCDPDALHTVVADHQVVSATLNVTTSAPGPHELVVALEQGGRVIAASRVTRDLQLEARDLPPGDITVRLHPASGALIAYHATLQLTYKLPVPPSLR